MLNVRLIQLGIPASKECQHKVSIHTKKSPMETDLAHAALFQMFPSITHKFHQFLSVRVCFTFFFCSFNLKTGNELQIDSNFVNEI